MDHYILGKGLGAPTVDNLVHAHRLLYIIDALATLALTLATFHTFTY